LIFTFVELFIILIEYVRNSYFILITDIALGYLHLPQPECSTAQ